MTYGLLDRISGPAKMSRARVEVQDTEKRGTFQPETAEGPSTARSTLTAGKQFRRPLAEPELDLIPAVHSLGSAPGSSSRVSPTLYSPLQLQAWTRSVNKISVWYI